MYKVKRNLFLYGVFILKSQRLGNLNCVLSLTVFIKTLGLCLALCSLSFVRQCKSLYTWWAKHFKSPAKYSGMSHQLLLTLNFQGCFVPAQSLSCFCWFVLHAWPGQCQAGLIFSCWAGQRCRDDPTGPWGRCQVLAGSSRRVLSLHLMDGRMTSHIWSKPGGILNNWAQKSVLCLGCG